MLDSTTKRKIDTARDILVGKVPDPKSQIEQITLALIYKFMNDTDKLSTDIGGKPSYFVGEYERFSWDNIIDPRLTGQERMNLYTEGLERMGRNPHLPELFRNVFKNAFLPFRSPETLNLFLEEIDGFQYDHSERLGDAYEYLLSVMSSQGDAGQFRTPRHIIDFIVQVVDPNKRDTILDPACGTAGFLISAIKHILAGNTKDYKGDLLDIEEKKRLAESVVGYDISPDMRRISLVNMFLHQINDPHIYEYDTLSSQERWDEDFSCILANPPFMSPKGGIKPHERFGIKSTRSEVLFVDYIMEHLTIDGKAGVIVPEGIIFQSQKAFMNLRKKMIDDLFLWAVVSLPAGVFNPYSGVKTSILFFDRQIAKKTEEILFVKIEADGYGLGAQRKPIEQNDLPEAYQALMHFKNNLKLPSGESQTKANGSREIAHTAPKKDIAGQDYNLSAGRYVQDVVKQGKWPRVKLGEVLEYEQPARYIVKSIDYDDSYKTPVLTAGKTFILGYTNEDDGIFDEPLPVIIFDDFTTSTQLVDFPFKVKSSAMKILKADEKVANLIYVYYAMQGIDFAAEEHKRYWISQYSNIEIPLPPLSAQQEIVAEIESCQKIIDGAKQIIANWKPKIDINPDWPMVKLGDLCDIRNGSTPSRTNPAYWGDGSIPWFTIEDIREQGRIINSTKQKITESALKKTSVKLLPPETVLLCCTASIGECAFSKIELTTNQQFNGIVVKDSFKNVLLPKFLLWLSSDLKDRLLALSGKSTFPHVPIRTLKEIQIPLPPLSIQQEIVPRIEEEQSHIESCKKLIETYQSKIKTRITKLWEE